MPQANKDKAIAQAKQYTEEAAAKAEGRDVVEIDKVKEDADELLDEIDSLLEEQDVLIHFRQRGGQ